MVLQLPWHLMELVCARVDVAVVVRYLDECSVNTQFDHDQCLKHLKVGKPQSRMFFGFCSSLCNDYLVCTWQSDLYFCDLLGDIVLCRMIIFVSAISCHSSMISFFHWKKWEEKSIYIYIDFSLEENA